MSKTTNKGAGSKMTTPQDASRVQGSVARSNGGVVPKGSQAGRMQRAASRNFGKSGGK